MANTTIVYFVEKKNDIFIFRSLAPKRDTLQVESFENGVVTIDPMYDSTITTVAEIVAGCFEKDSNFTRELFRAFECNENTAFTGIKFTFNEVTVMVTKENADKDKIYAEWKAGVEANAKKHSIEMESYMKTPQYRVKRAKVLKIATRRETVVKDVITVDESTKLQFKDEEAEKKWKQWVENNSESSCVNSIVTYARRWAKYMQYLMEKHNKTVAEIADNASSLSGVDDMTLYMHIRVVAILAQCWKYGEELRKWHNRKWGEEDADGVVLLIMRC